VHIGDGRGGAGSFAEQLLRAEAEVVFVEVDGSFQGGENGREAAAKTQKRRTVMVMRKWLSCMLGVGKMTPNDPLGAVCCSGGNH
jgi:hypothetical protein